jgi:hypothetical protein
MVGEPRVEDVTHSRMFAQEFGDGEPIAAVPLHPHRQCLDATQHEPAVERPRHRPTRILMEFERLVNLRVVADHDAANNVGVPPEVLGAGVQDEICSQGQRVLQIR